MAGGAKSNSTSSSKGGRPTRSVGAAAAKPNGAILDDTAEVMLQRRQRFDAWKKGYRGKSLTENAFTKLYKNQNP
jgi:hypothetical protein